MGQTVTAVNSALIPRIIQSINYAKHSVRIQYRMRNPYKQESVLVCNLEHCYNIRNGSVMFYSFDVKEFFFKIFTKFYFLWEVLGVKNYFHIGNDIRKLFAIQNGIEKYFIYEQSFTKHDEPFNFSIMSTGGQTVQVFGTIKSGQPQRRLFSVESNYSFLSSFPEESYILNILAFFCQFKLRGIKAEIVSFARCWRLPQIST